jgi:metallo-beta-lactamase class B
MKKWPEYNVGMTFRLILPLLATAALLPAQNDWNDPFPPHRIADHLYYVGSKGLSTYLITTSKGHILINSSFERTVPLIRASVEKLGYKFSDVKILLGSHAHGDHMEGNALVKELTGAQVYVMRGDDQIIAEGGKPHTAAWKPCKVDRVLNDGDTVTLGEAVLTAHLTPGHTRGCTTWTMKAKDAGKTLDVVIVGSVNVNPGYQLVNNKDYPEIAGDYARTFRIMKALHCEIFLGAHGNYYGMEAKYARLKPGAANPFVDPGGYRAYIEEREQAYLNTLHQQQQ